MNRDPQPESRDPIPKHGDPEDKPTPFHRTCQRCHQTFRTIRVGRTVCHFCEEIAVFNRNLPRTNEPQ